MTAAVPNVPKEQLNQHGRDPYAPSERDRAKDGFTKLAHKDFWPDVFRLCSDSKIEIGLILWGFRMVGAPDKTRKKTPGWTPYVRWEELAGRFCCSVKTVQDAAHDLDIPSAQKAKNATGKGRGVIEVEERRGEVRFKLLTELWETLPDYQPGRPVLVEPPKLEESKEPVALTKKPVRVRKDKASRPITVRFAVKKIRCKAVGFSAFDFSGIFSPADGILTLDILDPQAAPGARVPADRADSGAKGRLADTGRLSSPTKSNQPVAEENRNNLSTSFASSSPTVKDPAPVKNLAPVSVSVSSLAAALRVYGIADDAMARRVLRDCQSHAPTCTVEEVVKAVEEIGESLSPKVRSPMAVIRTMAPQCFITGAYQSAARQPARDRRIIAAMIQEDQAADALFEGQVSAITGDSKRLNLAKKKRAAGHPLTKAERAALERAK